MQQRKKKKKMVVVSILLVTGGLAITSLAFEGDVFIKPVIRPTSVMDSGFTAALGHPVINNPQGGDNPFLADEVTPVEDLPPLWPLENGSYVNFDSPVVKGLALSEDGSRLYAVNPTAATLDVFTTTSPDCPRQTATIPVGLDPVSVAVRPGSGEVWVVNRISDNITVVDPTARRVIAIMDTGDAPSNIVFDQTGSVAYVTCEGPILLDQTDPLMQGNGLVVYDAQSRQLLSKIKLDCNTPRAMTLDDQAGILYITALRSGNNTSVAGEPVVIDHDGTGDNLEVVPDLLIARDFSVTAAVFSASPELSPWPDEDPSGNLPPSPLTQRIVTDAGSSGPWQAVIAAIDGNGDGLPDQPVVAQFEQEFSAVNGFDVLEKMISDVKDTVDADLLAIRVTDPAQPVVISTVGNVGTTLMGVALQPDNGDVWVTNLEALNITRMEPNLNGHFTDHQIVRVQGAASGAAAVTPFDLHEGVPNFNDVSAPNFPAQAASLAIPMDVVISPDGSRAFVAAFGPGRVGMIDTSTGDVLSRVNVGDGPRSLVLDPSGTRLYCYNRTSMSISVIDVVGDQMIPAGVSHLFNAEPVVVRQGRKFMGDTRLSSNNWASACFSCHVDNSYDAVAWDLGTFDSPMQPGPPNIPFDPENPNANKNHPVKGPMVTQSLYGLRDHEPFHWRGDKTGFSDFNGAFENLMGGEQLNPMEMQAFEGFVKTLAYPPSPFYHRNNAARDPGWLNGAGLYITNCDACHQLTHDGALFTEDGDGGFSLKGAPLFGQLELVTQLRGIYRKLDQDKYNGFGTLHDGREEREENGQILQTFLLTFFPELTSQERDDLIAFVNAYPANAMPVIGWQLLADGPLTPAFMDDIDTMMHQFELEPSRCDVIAQGIIDGRRRGYVAISPTDFRSDDGELVTLDTLLAWSEQPGNSLVFTAVPPGSGQRLGIDRDMDCIFNAVDPSPSRKPDLDNDGDVDQADLGQLLSHYGMSGCGLPEDLNNSGTVDQADLGDLLSKYGTDLCP